MLDLPPDHPDLIEAREKAHTESAIAAILNNQKETGYWVSEGPGYNPKYYSTVWSVIMLAQLGASAAEDQRIKKGCLYILDNALTVNGQFSGSGTPGGTVDCLQGNLCAAMLDLGINDPRLDKAFEWMARSVTGEGVAPMTDKGAPLRYYSGKLGPGFLCGANNKLPCAWGAVKVMLAFSKMPVEKRKGLIRQAIDSGVDFLFSVDPASAAYPSGYADKPSGNWWKFGFPVFYVTDLLQLLEALAGLGFGLDPRLENALSLVLAKQDQDGRWPLEYDYIGKTWVEFGKKGLPNEWVTLRALRFLKQVYTAAY